MGLLLKTKQQCNLFLILLQFMQASELHPNLHPTFKQMKNTVNHSQVSVKITSLFTFQFQPHSYLHLPFSPSFSFCVCNNY